MPVRRINPNRVKLHRSYSVEELARCLDVHKNTVRHWQAKGLEPIDKGRPVLFKGATARAFLTARNSSRKCRCPPGTFYCFSCRCPRAPALGMVDFIAMRPGSGNLRALCECCETIMHRRVREHEHRHVHDAHHQHTHGPDDPEGEPHTHRHRHFPLTHSHAHFPDLHHRHKHG